MYIQHIYHIYMFSLVLCKGYQAPDLLPQAVVPEHRGAPFGQHTQLQQREVQVAAAVGLGHA